VLRPSILLHLSTQRRLDSIVYFKYKQGLHHRRKLFSTHYFHLSDSILIPTLYISAITAPTLAYPPPSATVSCFAPPIPRRPRTDCKELGRKRRAKQSLKRSLDRKKISMVRQQLLLRSSVERCLRVFISSPENLMCRRLTHRLRTSPVVISGL
jgi:hypothetical protein